MIQSFHDLEVYQLSYQLMLIVHKKVKEFPRYELRDLSSQIRRASKSIPANIAEGSGRPTSADFARFLSIALGSLSEVDYYVILARDLEYINATIASDLGSRIADLRRMMTKFRSTLVTG